MKLVASAFVAMLALSGCQSAYYAAWEKVGVEKRDLMMTQFNDADIEAQLHVKDVFDPRWLLNPTKVFPLDATETRRSVT